MGSRREDEKLSYCTVNSYAFRIFTVIRLLFITVITSPARSIAITLSVSLSRCNVYNVANVANVANVPIFLLTMQSRASICGRDLALHETRSGRQQRVFMPEISNWLPTFKV